MKFNVRIFTILFLVILLLGAGHWYLWHHIVHDLELPSSTRKMLGGTIIFLGASMILQPIIERTLPRKLSVISNWIASMWMGFGFLLLVLLGLSSLISNLIFYSLPDALASSLERSTFHYDATFGALVLTFVISSWALLQAMRFPVLKHITIPLKRWSQQLDGLTIIQLSDIHIGPLRGRKFAQRLVALVNAQKPDLIVITGDAIDGTVKRIRYEVNPLKDLRAELGVYFITGNHEHYYHPDEWCREFTRLGHKVLQNEHVTLTKNETQFVVAGTHDYRGAFNGPQFKEDLSRALGDRDPLLPVILLAHDPSTFKKAQKMQVDLQLSGHTHGGQIWPFMYLVRLIVNYVAGLYHESESVLYVSRGTGFWGPPMRLFAPAEISILHLHQNREVNTQ